MPWSAFVKVSVEELGLVMSVAELHAAFAAMDEKSTGSVSVDDLVALCDDGVLEAETRKRNSKKKSSSRRAGVDERLQLLPEHSWMTCGRLLRLTCEAQM